MSAWLDDGDVRIYHGDALEQLAAMPAESVQCIVTSPPFWNLRDYGDEGQIGTEATPDEWCERLVAVFHEARRVLRDDGVLWLEVGDTYAGSWGAQGRTGQMADRSVISARQIAAAQRKPTRTGAIPAGVDFKPKDIVGAPWLLAFALRADGWYLRSDTIWARPNPMPESVTDRPTKAHSYVFLLTKNARYFYDADAIREPNTDESIARAGRSSRYDDPAVRASVPYAAARPRVNGDGGGRNARSVWSIATEPTPFAHFATFPQALVERCILAGTSERGACAACGTPWQRQTTRTLENPGNRSNNGKIERSSEMRAYDARREVTVETTGWAASCDCVSFEAGDDFGTPIEVRPPPRPCVVLDPFMGSGTTALVARRLGRNAVGIELNADYLAIAAKRLQQLSLLGEPA